MKKVQYQDTDGLFNEYIIDDHPGKKGRFVIKHYRQFNPCNFHTLCFNAKQFKSRTSAANYLLQYLNKRMETGEITRLTIL